MTLRKHPLAKFAVALILLLHIRADTAYWQQCLRQPTEVFSGITYGCEILERTEDGHGILHWLRVDLADPGIDLYVTPLEPVAVEKGFQYRLRRIDDVVRN